MVDFLAVIATQPLAWLVLLLAAALLSLWKEHLRAGRQYTTAALTLLLFLGWLPLPMWLTHKMESMYPPPQTNLSRFAGVVVLGGSFVHPDVQTGRHQPQLNAHAERLTEAAALSRSFPVLRMVFTGGCASGKGCQPEADLARRVFAGMGLPSDRFDYESTSRTTFENARNTAQMPGIDRKQPWLLLTSAWHMPRAMATFQAQGWNVTPLPVDFLGVAHPDWADYSLGQGVEYWRLLLHEWIGMAAYRLTGKT